jgi:hypothetical protein
MPLLADMLPANRRLVAIVLASLGAFEREWPLIALMFLFLSLKFLAHHKGKGPCTDIIVVFVSAYNGSVSWLLHLGSRPIKQRILDILPTTCSMLLHVFWVPHPVNRLNK